MDINTKVDPEFQFILDCCLSFSIDNKKNQFDSLSVSEDLNEDKLYYLLQRHRILPLVSFFILNSNSFTAELKNRISVDFANNQLLALTNKRFENLFEQFLVDSNKFGFAFKGLSIASEYYGDVAVRQVFDVDLYVEESGIDRANEWLSTLGYKELIGFNSLTNRQKKFFTQTGHDLLYYSENKNLPPYVELHWRLKEGLGGFSLEPLTRLSQVDEFLYLCVHGTEHAWFRLKWICDIVQIIKVREFDWDAVKKRAVELNCINHFNITWIVLNKYFQIQIPHQIELFIDREKYRSHIKFISQALIMEVPYRSSRIGKFKHLFFLGTLNTRGIRIFSFLKFLTSHNDWKLIKVPDSLFFIYFLLRPILWLYRGFLSFSKPNQPNRL